MKADTSSKPRKYRKHYVTENTKAVYTRLLYAVLLRNALKLSLSGLQLAINTLKFSRKTSQNKNAKVFICSFGAPKNGLLFLRRAEKLSTFLGIGGSAPLLEKNCVRPCRHV